MKTAVTISSGAMSPTLAAFFAHCDAVLISDGDGDERVITNQGRRGDDVCQIVLAQRAHRLICGFIPEDCKQRLREAGVDIRLGSCSQPVFDLIVNFGQLPFA